MSAPNILNVSPNNSLSNPLNVSCSETQFDITPDVIPNDALDQVIRTLSSSFYPTVGYTYQITLNFTFDIGFVAAPSGIVNLGLGYWDGSIYTVAARESSYCASTTSDLYGSVTLVFTHTAPTNVVRLIATNLSNQNISGGGSTISVTGFSVMQVSSSATNITTNPFA